MIERKFIAQNIKELQIQEYITQTLKNVGHSHTKMQRTPLGEKIIIYASRPGLIVGKKGQNIKKLTEDLKTIFKLENPQIEIAEVENINLDSQIVAEKIANSMEKFGSARFKAIGHKAMTEVMNSKAKGIEILISGKIPSSRAKTWRFYQGYLKKSGDVAITGVDIAYASAKLKTGIVGIKVSIMKPDIVLPDKIDILEDKEESTDKTSQEKVIVIEPAQKNESEGKEETAENKEEKKPRKKKASKKDKVETEKTESAQ